MKQHVTVWTDPTQAAREAGRLQGRKEMRDQVREQLLRLYDQYCEAAS